VVKLTYATPLKVDKLGKRARDRLDDGMRRVYDPIADPVVGRDSPGVKYESVHTIGNAKM